MEDEYKKWLSQYRKGYIELSILIILNEKENLHGLALINYFESIELKINEGTLYPLLNRMEQNGWLSSNWNMPKTKGHPKKEYSLDKKGQKMLPILLEAYEKHHKSLMKIKEK